ncbi:ABC transporter ATP-binding protein [Acrocarpospora pleiomorpha]|uniref:ABC transporter ATP-binding protein n=1 Tax=Acrocarpospora pleiomorpha TaxID=90975 RepID=A0A5M3XVP2_9ACTN|nr:ATP-binding cassette domain-containing protein [Acrocarpospora pleiomorpha]GES23621.1 ABC transporter ATP-binding protein [Acrocarpospora pleiomorpha]
MTGSLLRVRDLSVRAGSLQLLHDISFDVAGQGTTVILGRNGAGKTTTLRAILGQLRSSGSVCFAGQEVANMPTHALVRMGIGYVPEDRRVFPGLTVAENLRLAERDRPDYDRVHTLFPDLAHRGKQRAGTLSGGQQQMLSLARALLNDNRLLVIDEPTKGLSPAVVTTVTAALAAVARTVPVLLVEQNLQVVSELAHGAVVVNAGRVAWTGNTRALLHDAHLTRTLLGVAA